MPPPEHLIAIAIRCAAVSSLDPALVCAVIEQESSWNMWAIRYEPAFFSKYVAPLFTNNKINASEAWSRGYSWGLMQVMGQVARENGFAAHDHPFLSELCDPEQGIAVGCRVLARKFVQAARDFRFTPPSLYCKAPSATSLASGSASAPSSANSPASNSPSRPDPSKGAPPRNPAVPSSPSSSLNSSSQHSSSQLLSTSASSTSSSNPTSIVTATPTDLALITRALLLWNGGSNPEYARQVLARLPHYA